MLACGHVLSILLLNDTEKLCSILNLFYFIVKVLHLPVLRKIKSVVHRVEYLPSVPEAMGSILRYCKEQERLLECRA